MADLFTKAKQIFPTASDDEINQGIQKIKLEAPEASDDEILSTAQKMKMSMDDGSFKTGMMKEGLRAKYGLDKYSPDARKQLVDQNAAESKQFSGLALLGGIGTAIAGKGGSGAMDIRNIQEGQRKDKLSQFDSERQQTMQNFAYDRDISKAEKEDQISARESDPNSEESKLAQQLAKDMGYAGDTSKMTAAQFKQFSPALQKKYEIEQKKLDRQEARSARQSEQALKREEKQQVRDEKKKTTLTEVEDRRMNIEDNLTQLENMIKDKGTYEMFGSHNADLDRRVEMIATDMAKLADPNSVARPSEVEAFKKGLIQSNATGMRNSTALDILKNFRNEVNQRTENAYKIRGLENPGTKAQKETTSGKIRVSNGKEVMEIDPSDEADAAADGFKRV